MAQQVFWRRKKLHEMTSEEWEALCDGCGKCCLHKLEDEDTGHVYYTDVTCRYLDSETCSCQDYTNRLKNVPECLDLTIDDIADFFWLPETCAYRLLAEGKQLFDWHPLVSGDPASIHTSGVSVLGKTTAETEVKEEDMEDHIVRWVI